jgi:hypothetical protein
VNESFVCCRWHASDTDSAGLVWPCRSESEFRIGRVGVALYGSLPYVLSFMLAGQTTNLFWPVTAQIIDTSTQLQNLRAPASSSNYYRTWQTFTMTFIANAATEQVLALRLWRCVAQSAERRAGAAGKAWGASEDTNEQAKAYSISFNRWLRTPCAGSSRRCTSIPLPGGHAVPILRVAWLLRCLVGAAGDRLPEAVFAQSAKSCAST